MVTHKSMLESFINILKKFLVMASKFTSINLRNSLRYSVSECVFLFSLDILYY